MFIQQEQEQTGLIGKDRFMMLIRGFLGQNVSLELYHSGWEPQGIKTAPTVTAGV